MLKHFLCKKILILLTLFFLYPNDGSSIHNLQKHKKIGDDTISSVSISTLNNIATSPTTGYTITKPGYYYLSCNLTLAPGGGNYSGIYINASNVILDLNNNSLLLTTTGNIPAGPIYGIQIAPNANNVTVLNGFVNGQGISAPSLNIGIYAAGTSSQTIKSLVIAEVNILNCALYGIKLNNCNNFLIEDSLANNTVSSTVGNFPAGLYASGCIRGTINSSHFRESSFIGNASQGACYGAYITNCHNVLFNETKAGGNYITSINTTQQSGVYGFYLTQSNGIICHQCVSNDNLHLGMNTNSSAGNECCGYFLDQTVGCIFTDSSAVGNIGGHQYGSNYTCSTYGFKITNSSDGNAFYNCLASTNRGSADTAGFMIGQSGDSVFENCLSLNNTSSKTNFGSRFSFGFTNTFATDNHYLQCKALGNAIASRASNKGYGFCFRTEKNSLLKECTADSNGPGSRGTLGEAYGVAFTGNCSLCILDHCQVYGNLGSTRQYGFKDFANNCQTLLKGNIFFGHGTMTLNANALTDAGAMNCFLNYNPSSATNNVRNQFVEANAANMSSLSSAGSGSDAWINYSIVQN